MKNPFVALATVAAAIKQHTVHRGRRARVGQYVREELDESGHIVKRDYSEQINFERSRQYPHSGERQRQRELRRRERRKIT